MDNIGYRPTWAEINLSNLAHNLQQVKKHLKPGTKIMPTVKADAYGHGLIPVAKKLVACGIDYLGVASIDEGIKLRQAAVKAPILILGIILKKDIAPLFKYRLTPTVSSEDFARALNKMAAKHKPLDIHIKVDTGMGRIGVLYPEALDFIQKVRRLKSLHIEGLFTHLACADINRDFTLYQLDNFNCLAKKIERLGIKIPLIHAANSLGVVNYQESHFNLVRPGLVIYGLYPDDDRDIGLKPVLSLKTRVVYIKEVPQGYGISYGHTYITKDKTRIAVLPLGYGDGYPRNLSNLSSVLIGGERFKISGRVCMDQIMVDIGKARVLVGDEAVLIGCQGKNKITAEELAKLSGTIPYEIVCGLGSRIPRIY